MSLYKCLSLYSNNKKILSILIYGRLSRLLLEANEDDTDKEVDRNEEQLCFQLIRLKKWKSGEEQACCKQE